MTRGLISRQARWHARVVRFAETLEQVCIEAVEAGEMTKDLAVLISKNTPFLYTEDFLDAIDRRLQAKMA